MSSARRPANPTKQTSITFTAPANINKGTKVSVNLANAGYYNLYDCTTWGTYYDISYDYVGLFGGAVTPTTQTKTFLVKSGSMAMQSFAFDLEEE